MSDWVKYVAFFGGAVAPAMLVALIGGFVVRRFAARLGLMDQPNERKVHTTPIPLGGGLAIWAGVVSTFAALNVTVLVLQSNPALVESAPALLAEHLGGLNERMLSLWGLVAGGTVLMLLGLYDDRRGLPWQLRLAIQLLVALAVVVFYPSARLTGFIEVTWFTCLLSSLWIVGLINSFNMLDNMDASSGGIAAISSTFLALFLVTSPAVAAQPQWFVAGFLLVLVGSLLGFLFHNRPPAKLFMGDAGAYLVGYWIAIGTSLSTYTTYHSASPHAILAPLFVMAVPLYDTITVLTIRLREGRSLYEADKSHFTHRLVDLGLTKGQSVLTAFLLTATCGLCALLLRRVGPGGAFVLALVVVCVLALINILETTARRKIRE